MERGDCEEVSTLEGDVELREASLAQNLRWETITDCQSLETQEVTLLDPECRLKAVVVAA